MAPPDNHAQAAAGPNEPCQVSEVELVARWSRSMGMAWPSHSTSQRALGPMAWSMTQRGS